MKQSKPDLRRSRAAPRGSVAPRHRPTGEELLLVAIIVLAGFGLRIAFLERMAVEHFDEGVYTSELWFAGKDTRYPDRYLYAPPLVPALAAWSMHGLGPTHLGTMLPSIAAGALTILAVWLAARTWFGLEAGLAAATLAALSDFHILYSRTVLTDALLGLWLVLAVYWMWRALESGRPSSIAGAGVVTGLAWWTKYNGWLPLAIGITGVLGWMLFDRNKSHARSRRRPLAIWLAIAGVAVAVWSPVWLHIQNESPEGYRAVAANHARYVVGLAGWWESLVWQLGNHRLLNGWLTVSSAAAAVLIPAAFTFVDARRSLRNHPPLRAGHLAGLLLVALAAGVGRTVVLGILAAVGIALQLRQRRPLDGGRADPGSPLAAWLLAAWFAGLCVATPLYRPYPRLTLPWLISAWLGTAALVGWWFDKWRVTANAGSARALPFRSRARAALAACLVAAVALLIWSAGPLSERGVPGWQWRTGMERIAGEIMSDAADVAKTRERNPSVRVPYVTYVYAEPALVFHLASAGIVAQPAGSLGFARSQAGPRVPTFLISGPHAHRSQQFQDEWREVGSKFDLVEAYPYAPSDFVLLNHYPPATVAARSVPPQEVRLYLLR